MMRDRAGMYRCSKGANEYSMVFSASYVNVDRVCRHIEQFLRQHGLDHSFVIELGAREILNNAITHGSQQDPLKNVRFRIFLEGNRLYLQSRDEGKGFQPTVQPQSVEGNPYESGRGFAILHEYFDSVSMNESGNEVTLELKIVNPS